MLNPLHLTSFDAVLRTGSFAGAARALGYTSSAVSQHVAALEHELGATLFDRAARSVAPTAAAHALAGPARRVLAVLDGVEAEFTGWASGRSGHLRLGGFPTANQHLLPAALRQLGRDAPGATLTLEEGEPAQLIRSLREGRLDLALVYEYDGVPLDLGVADGRVRDTGPLLRESLLLLAPAGTVPHGTRLCELADRAWVSTAETSLGWHLLRRACLEAGFAPRIHLRSNDYAVIRQLVAAGLGVALVPALAAADVAAGIDPTSGRSVDRPTTTVQLADLRLGRRVRLVRAAGTGNPLLPAAQSAFARAAVSLGRIPGVRPASAAGLAPMPKNPLP